MSKGAVSGDRIQQARDNVSSRRQSGLEPRREDLEVLGLLDEAESEGEEGREDRS